MEDKQSAPQWILNKLEVAKHEEVVNICVVLWGIWYWRNKKVWDDQTMNPVIAMENSSNVLKEWKAARQKHFPSSSCKVNRASESRRWEPPKFGTIKLNVDASFFPEASTFSIGMVIRNHEGVFVEGRSMTLPHPENVFAAECIGVREFLSWLMSCQDQKGVVETDSLLTYIALSG